MNSIDIQMAKNTMDKLFEELEFWIKRSMPKHGEVWIKEPCDRGMCRIGWSFGVGTYMIDRTQNWSYDAIDAIKCGCLHKDDKR